MWLNKGMCDWMKECAIEWTNVWLHVLFHDLHRYALCRENERTNKHTERHLNEIGRANEQTEETGSNKVVTFRSLQSELSGFLQHVHEELSGSSDGGESDGFPGSSCVEVDHLVLSFSLNPNPPVFVEHDVNSGRRNEVEFRADLDRGKGKGRERSWV